MVSPKSGLGMAAIVVVLLAVGRTAAAQTTYAILDLGVLPSDFSSSAYGLNSQGKVVGISQSSGGTTRGFLFSGGSMFDIGSLGGDTFANAVNSAGKIAGSSFSTAAGTFRAFRTAAGATVDGAADLGTFPTAGSLDSFAYGINAAGQTVGYAYNGTGNHAFRTSANGAIDGGSDLGTLGGANSYANGINASGQTAGYSDTAPDSNGNSVTHAFRADADGSLHDLGTLGGDNAYATALNDSGQVIGYSLLSDGSTHAFRTSSNTAISPLTDDLGTLGGTFSYAYSINSSGMTVGYSATVAGEQRAFVVQGPVMFDLTNLLVNNAAGWTLTDARAVNTQGQIAGAGIVQGQQHAFLLTPTAPSGAPEPGSLALLAASAGSALLLALKKIGRGKKTRFRVK